MWVVWKRNDGVVGGSRYLPSSYTSGGEWRTGDNKTYVSFEKVAEVETWEEVIPYIKGEEDGVLSRV